MVNAKQFLRKLNLANDDRRLLAKQLFPHALYPDKCLLRVIHGKQLLNEEQINILAEYFNINISQLN